MKTLLKKAGIVVAATTAALLAVSPLAFAGSVEHKDAKPAHSKKADDKDPSGDCNIAQSIGSSSQTNGLLSILNFNDLVDANVAVPICDNNVNVQVIPIGSPNTQTIK
jgi:hypothetical protein